MTVFIAARISQNVIRLNKNCKTSVSQNFSGVRFSVKLGVFGGPGHLDAKKPGQSIPSKRYLIDTLEEYCAP